MASFVYDNAQKLFLSGALNLIDNNIKVLLTTSTYSPSQASHTVTGDLGSSEATGTAYVKGGELLTSRIITVSAGVAKFDAADVSWTSSTITASGAVIYQSGSTPSTAYLIQYIDFTANQSSSNGTFQIVWNSDGILTLGEV